MKKSCRRLVACLVAGLGAGWAHAYNLALDPSPTPAGTPVELLVHGQSLELHLESPPTVTQVGNVIRAQFTMLNVPVGPITYRAALGSFPPGSYVVEFYTRLQSAMTPPNHPPTLRGTIELIVEGAAPVDALFTNDFEP